MSQINPDRPLLVGPEVPIAPFPYKIIGTVVKGYGRGSRELGIPTANLSDNTLEMFPPECHTGVYYGFVQIDQPKSTVYPMVMSLGWNPYYHNEKRSAEVHIIHEFPQDFYGVDIRVLVLGYIRPEQDYPSLAALIRDIKTDVEVAKHSLKRPAYEQLQNDDLFTT
ncbi:uncharacterized protein BX664DRAFT_323118 [Halteromyces radiatus]|uniref:uncharacterized protein n=1 Tax=Halteromyces radiatus TaxID=101107 RepID=UPI002220A853|nr:uncharacterized protein BX664DRAFT_323118 [Halteromyces radiatus]KAI8100198.1 hypothetical protein BX664DRAFT_323118 [Halteromyces radiatus]